MRCKLCNKIVNGISAYQTHLRMTHKMPSEERIEIIKEVSNMYEKASTYRALRSRLLSGELLTKEEFAIVRVFDERYNSGKAAIYTKN